MKWKYIAQPVRQREDRLIIFASSNWVLTTLRMDSNKNNIYFKVYTLPIRVVC